MTDLRDNPCDLYEQAVSPPDEVLTETPDMGGYFPFRGIVIGSVLGLGIWLLIWLLA